MADTTVQLGDFVFTEFEVPENIPFGGDQMIAVHKLIGGARTVDSMGADDEALQWSGRFRGPSALRRALYLDSLRKAGKPLSLTWSSLSYVVKIKRFICTFERYYEIPYTITCEVAIDNIAPVSTIAAVTVDAQVNADATAASSAAANVADPKLTTMMGSVQSAIASVNSFVGATTSQINSVLQPISAAQGYVQSLVNTATATISNVASFGGVVAGGNPLTIAAALTGQAAAMENLVNLGAVSDLLTRMSTNLQADGASGAALTVAGGNLYAIAAQAYGDPSEWTTIAQANGLTDPILTGINTIRIPAQPSGDDGVWSQ